MEDVLKQLERFGISNIGHGRTTLTSHLKGTYEILKRWNCDEDICLAGLCHSIYGTESFSKTPATLDNREYVQSLIGIKAEKLAYYFGAYKKGPFWHNLDKSQGYILEDRFTEETVSISKQEFSELLTMILANWLEQRPREEAQYLFICQNEFMDSKPFIPAMAFQDFLEAYGLTE